MNLGTTVSHVYYSTSYAEENEETYNECNLYFKGIKVFFKNEFIFAFKRKKKRVLKVELARINLNLHSSPVKVPVVSYCFLLGRESLVTGRTSATPRRPWEGLKKERDVVSPPLILL